MSKNDYQSNKDKDYAKGKGTQTTGSQQQAGTGQKIPSTNLGGQRTEKQGNLNPQQKQPWTHTGSMTDKDKNKNR